MEENNLNQTKGGFNPWVGVVIVFLVLGAGGYYYMSMNKSAYSPLLNEGSLFPSTTGSMEKEGNIVTVNMEAGSFYFKPDKISVKKGDTVKITFKAVDMMHNFYLDQFNVKGPTVKSGNTDTVQFTADKAGTFEFYCNVSGHRANGQVGTLTVE